MVPRPGRLTRSLTMLVMKFGGSSVANHSQIEKVLEIVRTRTRGTQALVVSSAHKGMTDALVDAATRAARGTADAEPVIAQQQAVARSLGCPDDLLSPFYAEIRDLLRGISLVKELSPRSLDYISSFGERMAVRCIADFFTRRGLPSQAYDAWELGFITDKCFGGARPVAGAPARMRALFADPKVVPPGTVPIVTGFIGKTEAGEITTVGRNGSDLTATLFGAALGASEVEIWTDTDGVMTADPSVVRTAQNIPEMAFDEAAELAYFGSRMLHPSTLIPAMEQSIPVRVCNTNRPEHPGTVIAKDRAKARHTVTSIAYKERQVVLTISSTRMFGQAGFLAEIATILRSHGVIVDMIATSEVSVSLTTNDPEKLEAALPELERFGQCHVATRKTILVVVGQKLPSERGVAAQVFSALARAGVNIEMMSYALGSINLAMVIDDGDIATAVLVLHRELFETPA